jgi:hypothetical protein
MLTGKLLTYGAVELLDCICSSALWTEFYDAKIPPVKLILSSACSSYGVQILHQLIMWVLCNTIIFFIISKPKVHSSDWNVLQVLECNLQHCRADLTMLQPSSQPDHLANYSTSRMWFEVFFLTSYSVFEYSASLYFGFYLWPLILLITNKM